MAKKSSSSRHKPTTARAKSPAQKQQAPERASTATLVRPGGNTGPSASNVVVAPPVAASEPQPLPQPKPQPKPAPRKTAVATKPTTATKAPVAAKSATSTPAAAQPDAAAKPAPSKPTAPRPAASSTRDQNAQLARVRATQRARTARTISAENYAYVLGDLKLVVGLAVTAFVALIALTFVLPH